MSELTPCNHCSLQRIQSEVEREGATVQVQITEELPGWLAVMRSDRPEPVAYFVALSAQCVC